MTRAREQLRHTYSDTGTLEWQQVNGHGRLVPAHLIHSFGPATYAALSRHWDYGPQRGDGVVPLNQILRFTAGALRVQLRDRVERHVRYGPVVERGPGGELRRAWVLCDCELRRHDEVLAAAEFWLALTRPFAPPPARRVDALPPELAALGEIPLGDEDLPRRAIETYSLPRHDAAVFSDDGTHVFHADRTDSYRHVNTVVYAHVATDAAARAAWKHGLDAGRLRFRELVMCFRKPFVTGDIADVACELRAGAGDFAAAVRFRHHGGAKPLPSAALWIAGEFAADADRDRR